MASPFDRNTVAALMVELDVDVESISGHKRSTYPARVLDDFDTFDTLFDPVDYFGAAMKIELEHGSAGGNGTNVTRDDALATAKIVAAHLSGVEYGKTREQYLPFPLYYDWLIWVERLHELAVRKLAPSPSLNPRSLAIPFV